MPVPRYPVFAILNILFPRFIRFLYSTFVQKTILEKDLSHMPETLILTAEFDPLRDEGEEYGKRLKEANNYVEIHRIPDALHGYFALGIRFQLTIKSKYPGVIFVCDKSF